jgi:hypothetical protein
MDRGVPGGELIRGGVDGWVVGERLETENLDGYIEKPTWGGSAVGTG